MTISDDAFVRLFQERAGLGVDGVAGPATLAKLDEVLPPKARRTINAAGLQLIKDSEGLELKAYRDPVGIWTIGYGSTGKHVTPGKVITEAAAEALLLDDLSRFESKLAALAPRATDNQFAAMVSLAFNVGTAAFESSTLLRKHLAGDHMGAADEFKRWRFAGGRELPGLVKRRAREAQLYRTAT